MTGPTQKQFSFAASLVAEVLDGSDTYYHFIQFAGYNSKGQAKKSSTTKEWSDFISWLLEQKNK